MARNYKGDPRARKYKRSNLANIKKAKNEVLKKLSIRQASQKYKIAYSVLQRHILRPNLLSQGGQTVLTNTEEEAIVARLKVCAGWEYPLDMLGLRLIVKSYLALKGRTVKRF